MGVVKLNFRGAQSSKKIGKRWRNLILSLVMILIVELAWVLLTSQPRQIVIAQQGTIEKGCWVEGILLRQEQLLTAPMKGHFYTKVDSGSLLPHGEIVGWIGAKSIKELPDNILKIVEKSANLESERVGLQLELKRLTSEIEYVKRLLQDPAAAAVAASYTGHQRTKQQLQEDLKYQEQEKLQLLPIIQNNQIALDQRNQELSELSKFLEIELVFMDRPGIFCAEYDGFEDQYSPEDFSVINEKSFKHNYSLNSVDKKVDQGEILGKIIDPFVELLVVMVNPKKVGSPQVGDKWSLKTEEDWIKLEIVELNQLADDKMILGFASQGGIEQFNPQRRQKFFMIYRSCQGISVPVQALFKKGETTVVKVLRENDHFDQAVTVLESDGQRAIVSGLKFGTAILSR